MRQNLQLQSGNYHVSLSFDMQITLNQLFLQVPSVWESLVVDIDLRSYSTSEQDRLWGNSKTFALLVLVFLGIVAGHYISQLRV